MAYYCECDYRGTPCGKVIKTASYLALSQHERDLEDDLFIIHEDHLAGEAEVRRHGDCVLVRGNNQYRQSISEGEGG